MVGLFLLSVFASVACSARLCVDLDALFFMRTDVLLAAACARLRTPYVLCVCGHMRALYGSDNSALIFTVKKRWPDGFAT